MERFCDNKQCSRHAVRDRGDGHTEELTPSSGGFSPIIREALVERKVIGNQVFRNGFGSFRLCETCEGVLDFVTTGGDDALDWTMLMMRVRDTAQKHNLTVREANELWNGVLMAKALED